jgi:hypothetical protein
VIPRQRNDLGFLRVSRRAAFFAGFVAVAIRIRRRAGASIGLRWLAVLTPPLAAVFVLMAFIDNAVLIFVRPFVVSSTLLS